jgi:hypothetical protein
MKHYIVFTNKKNKLLSSVLLVVYTTLALPTVFSLGVGNNAHNTRPQFLINWIRSFCYQTENVMRDVWYVMCFFCDCICSLQRLSNGANRDSSFIPLGLDNHVGVLYWLFCSNFEDSSWIQFWWCSSSEFIVLSCVVFSLCLHYLVSFSTDWHFILTLPSFSIFHSHWLTHFSLTRMYKDENCHCFLQSFG